MEFDELEKKDYKIYENTKDRMKMKGFEYIGDLQVKSMIIEKLEFWVSNHNQMHILEVTREGKVNVYKETKV